jgi:hypothetical protein
MAISSTSFMAAPGLYSSTLVDKLDRIDCSQVLAAVLMADRALLGHIKMGPTAHNIEFNWIEDSLNAVTFEGCCTSSVSVSVIGFTGSASLNNIIRANSIITMKHGAASTENSFYLKVTSVTSTSLLTCTLYGSAAHVVATTTATWMVVSQPYGDSSDASSDITLTRSKKRNFMQIFERAVEIAQTRKGMDVEAVVDELQYQIKQRTLEIKRELNISVILGMAYADGAQYTADLDLRTMMGIINYIRDSNIDGTREDYMVKDVSQAALTVSHINDLLYKIWDAGGLDESADPIIVVAANQQRVISSWEKELRRVEQGERQVGYYRDIFLSDMGVELPVVLDRWMPETTLLVLDRSRVALRALQGDEWHMEKMAKTGRSEKWQISGQYGLEIRNPDVCHGIAINIAE